MTATDLALDEMEAIMSAVARRHLRVDPLLVKSDPITNAVRDVYECVVAGVKRVAVEGQAAIAHAQELVVRTWEERLPILKENAAKALVLFQKMISDLIRQMMEAIARSVPPVLNLGGEAKIDTLSYKMTLGISPSVGLAAAEVFKLSATAGVEVQIVYKAPASPAVP